MTKQEILKQAQRRVCEAYKELQSAVVCLTETNALLEEVINREDKEEIKMKIMAIWDRHIPAPESSTIFCLLDNGEFLELRLDTEYKGTDAEGKSLYKETGEPYYEATFGKGDRFTFGEANYMIRNFGGTLLINFEEKVKGNN